MPNRPQPTFPEPNTAEYWERAQGGELWYQTCDQCRQVVFTPRLHCTACGSRDLRGNASQGAGEIYTFSVVRRNRAPGFEELGPYAVALIDLDEGFRMVSTIVGIDDPLTEVYIGQRVQVEFETQDDGEYRIPVFRPASQ